MKRIILTFIFIFALAACNMPAETPVAMKQPATEVVLASPIVQPTAQPTFTQIVPLAPTSTLEILSPTQSVQAAIVPTATSPLPQTLPSSVIAFDTGGTFKDTQGSVSLGDGKIYTLNAMLGQVMSVSTVGGYFPLKIQGRDGTVLCPTDPNSQCLFWRGTLPLSQDYYITVKSDGMNTNFTLRVAINPPGKFEQTFSYNTNQVSLTYLDTFAPGNPLSTLNNKTTPQLTLQLIDTSSYVNTNLGEAYFMLGSSTDANVVATCTQPNQSGGGMETSNGNVTVNGNNFAYSSSADAGAGNLYEQNIYRVVNKNTCYEVIFFIHSTNIGNYSPGVVKEFDRQALMNKFNAILSSIQFK